jgi:hypothetical protein
MKSRTLKRVDVKNMKPKDILEIQKEISKYKNTVNSLSNSNKELLEQFAPNSKVGQIQFEGKAKKLFLRRVSELNQTMKKSKSKSPEVDMFAKIDKVFEERKFKRLLDKYISDLDNSNNNKSSWKVCSKIREKYPNYFLPNVNILSKSQRNIIAKPYKDNQVIVEDIGRGLTVMNKEDFEKMKAHISDPSKTERDTWKMICYFMDIVGFVTYQMRQQNIPIQLILKGGRALQLLAGNERIKTHSEIIEMINNKNANIDLMKSIVGQEFLESNLQFDSFDIDVIFKGQNEDHIRYAANKLQQIFKSIYDEKLYSTEIKDKKIFKVSYHEEGSGMTALADIGYGLPEGSTTAEYFSNITEHSFGDNRLLLTQTIEDFIREKEHMIENNLDNRYILKKALKSKLLSKMVKNKVTRKKKKKT